MRKAIIFLFIMLLSTSTTVFAKQTIIKYNNAGGSMQNTNFGSNAIALPKNSSGKSKQQTEPLENKQPDYYLPPYYENLEYYDNYRTTTYPQRTNSSSSSSSSSSYFQKKRSEPVTINGVTYY